MNIRRMAARKDKLVCEPSQPGIAAAKAPNAAERDPASP